MTDLNLLPSEYQPKGPVNLQNLLLILFSLGLAFALVMITVDLIGKSQGYALALSELKTQMIPYTKQYEDIRVAQQKLRLLEDRLPLIEELISQRLLWSKPLEELGNALPSERICLEQLEVLYLDTTIVDEAESGSSTGKAGKEADSQNTVLLPWLKAIGWAREVQDISAFVRSLGDTRSFEPPVLLTAQESEIKGRKLISFEMQVQLTERGSRDAKEPMQTARAVGLEMSAEGGL